MTLRATTAVRFLVLAVSGVLAALVGASCSGGSSEDASSTSSESSAIETTAIDHVSGLPALIEHATVTGSQAELEAAYLQVVRDEGEAADSITADFDLRDSSDGEVLAAGEGVCPRLDAGDTPVEVLSGFYTDTIISGNNDTIGRIMGAGVTAFCPEYLAMIASDLGNDPDTMGPAAIQVLAMLQE
jgi:hypothetical protein